MNFKSTAQIKDAIYVFIDGRQTYTVKDRLFFEQSEDDLSVKFLAWLCDHPEITSFPGGSSGQGVFRGWFPAEHRAAIEQFFKDQGVRPL